ncbi:MAG TPA: fatty acid desaturase [Acidimicrobiales bacterium]|nr:fatty acid desaturase [Acidimicrobiales bacterium]
MVPAPELLADVLPTARLTASGKPVPALRSDLRRIASVRNVGSVLLTWAQAAATVAAAVWLGHPAAWVAAFLAMGPAHARFAILARDALGVSGWKNLRGVLRALRARPSRPFALRLVAGQLVVLVPLALAGRPELYLALWLAPWLTVWQVLNRLRAIAEHAGMTASQDRRLTTHHVRQSWPARCLIVPFNTGWHLAHHVDMGVPWRNLPRLHRELVDAGWVTDAIVHPGYRALWRALRARPAAADAGGRRSAGDRRLRAAGRLGEPPAGGGDRGLPRHPLCLGETLPERLFITDSVETQPVELSDGIEVVSVAGLFGEAIRRISRRESISVLFS